MLDTMLFIGGWLLVCVLVYFSAHWAEREQHYLGHGEMSWGCLG